MMLNVIIKTQDGPTFEVIGNWVVMYWGDKEVNDETAVCITKEMFNQLEFLFKKVIEV